MRDEATYYKVSETPVGALFRGRGRRIAQDGLAVTYELESYRRPDIADSDERVVGRWSVARLEVSGEYIGGGQGVVAAGQGYLLLSDRFLRGTVTGSGSENRLLFNDKEKRRLRAFSGTYAFLFDLAEDVSEFHAKGLLVGLSGSNSGVGIEDPYVASAEWKSKPFALPGKRGVEFSTALLQAIIQAKQARGNEHESRAAAVADESDWRSRVAEIRRIPFSMKF